MMCELKGQAASGGAFERFRALVMTDPALQEQLWAVSEREAFMALAVALGKAHGCDFAAEDVGQALNAGRRAWIERWLP